MENKASIILKIASGVVLVIALILWGMALSQDIPEVGGMLNLTYILLGITGAAAIIFPIFVIIQDPKKAITFIAGLAFLLVVFGISYSMAEDTVTNGVIIEGSKMAEAGLTTSYILIVIAFVSWIGGEVYKAIK